MPTELEIARETNQRLNRRCQKAERRINRWESGQYTIGFWRDYMLSRTEIWRKRTEAAESELARLKNRPFWKRIFNLS